MAAAQGIDPVQSSQQFMEPGEWEELSDTEQMVDERSIEPDYFIDIAPKPTFIPDEAGKDKEIQLEEADMFNFKQEAAPILQVLVGKALELARIEVIEDYERSELLRHKKRTKTIRESSLIEVHRLEARKVRGAEEIDRRMLQKRVRVAMDIEDEKKQIARIMSKQLQ